MLENFAMLWGGIQSLLTVENLLIVLIGTLVGIMIGAIPGIGSLSGCAILLSSADLDEVLRLSDRIITLYEGRVTGEFAAEAITREQLGYYMTGDRTQEAST